MLWVAIMRRASSFDVRRALTSSSYDQFSSKSVKIWSHAIKSLGTKNNMAHDT